MPITAKTGPVSAHWYADTSAAARHSGPVPWIGLLRRPAQLYVGLFVYGIGGALQVRAGLGLDPWDVFHQGLGFHLGLAIGTVVVLAGAAVLLLWIPLRQWPGLGTLSNMVLIGVWMNWGISVLPAARGIGWQVSELAGGILACGVASGLYIGARFGPGPRDGLMTGFARVTGQSLRLVRTVLELTVLAAGWLLGGVVGIGTVAYALGIGPLAQLFLRWFDTGDRTRQSSGGALGGEPGKRAGEPVVEVDDRSPAEFAGDQRGVGPAHPRVIDDRVDVPNR
jgi:uncharacterized membrane protein YczE